MRCLFFSLLPSALLVCIISASVTIANPVRCPLSEAVRAVVSRAHIAPCVHQSSLEEALISFRAELALITPEPLMDKLFLLVLEQSLYELSRQEPPLDVALLKVTMLRRLNKLCAILKAVNTPRTT